jgi:hypothetical protein
VRWELIAFAAALLVYAVTRFWRLGEYPIYFFTDEAFEPITAQQLLKSGLRDATGRLFPMYFQNGGVYAPVLPVYFHVISVALFGKSVRARHGAMFTILARASVGLIWKSLPQPVVGTATFGHHAGLVLHSRTTVQTAHGLSWLAFILCYLSGSPWFLTRILCAMAFTLPSASYRAGRAAVGSPTTLSTRQWCTSGRPGVAAAVPHLAISSGT